MDRFIGIGKAAHVLDKTDRENIVNREINVKQERFIRIFPLGFYVKLKDSYSLKKHLQFFFNHFANIVFLLCQ